ARPPHVGPEVVDVPSGQPERRLPRDGHRILRVSARRHHPGHAPGEVDLLSLDQLRVLLDLLAKQGAQPAVPKPRYPGQERVEGSLRYWLGTLVPDCRAATGRRGAPGHVLLHLADEALHTWYLEPFDLTRG